MCYTSIILSSKLKEVFCTKGLLILLMSAFFAQKSVFYGKNITFTNITFIVRAALEIFSFCKIKGYY